MSITRATALAAVALAAAVPSALALHDSAAVTGMASAKAAAQQLAALGPVAANPLDSVDHFKCYKASEPPPTAPGIPKGVILADQFGAFPQKVGKAIMLCNPVVKIHDGVQYGVRHPELHLVCFQIKQNLPHQVKVDNQFGRRGLDTQKASRLCLPSYKNQPPGPALPPLGLLDHYKCYTAREHLPASGQPAPGIPPIVTLIDQFVNTPVKVGGPSTLCNPVRKTHDDVVTDVRYPDIHLVCFRIKEKQRPPVTVNVYNQFQKRTLVVTDAVELCLPSRKQVVS
jgi:hypothetical protein